MQPETLKEHTHLIRCALPPRQTGAVPEILPARQMMVQAAHASIDALVVEVERLTAELEDLKSKLGDGAAVSSGDGPDDDWQQDVWRWRHDRMEERATRAEAALKALVMAEDCVQGTLAALRDDMDTAATTRVLEGPTHQRGRAWKAARNVVAATTSTAGDKRRLPNPASPLNENPGDSTAVREGSVGERVEWADLQAGDVVELRVFSLKHGSARETRTVVATDGKILTLVGDPERPGMEYEIVASEPDAAKRDLRRVSSTPSELGSLPEPSPPSSPLEGHETGVETGKTSA